MGYDKVLGSGGENVTPEVDAQGPLIQEIMENLKGKIDGANIVPEAVLEGYCGWRGQELVVGNHIPHGDNELFTVVGNGTNGITLKNVKSAPLAVMFYKDNTGGNVIMGFLFKNNGKAAISASVVGASGVYEKDSMQYNIYSTFFDKEHTYYFNVIY